MSIHLTAIIKVKPEYRAAISQLLNNMVDKTKREKACLQYDLHQSISDPNIFVFHELWSDQSGLDHHNQQEYIKEFGRFAPSKLQEPVQLYLTQKV